MYPEAAGLVARGGHYPSAIWRSAYDNGAACKTWVVKLLHGYEEGVHIDVEDGAGMALQGSPSIVPASEVL